jgi:hypothetical protein
VKRGVYRTEMKSLISQGCFSHGSVYRAFFYHGGTEEEEDTEGEILNFKL